MIRKEKLEELKSYYEELKTIKKEISRYSNFLGSVSYMCTLNNGTIIKREELIKGYNNGSASIIMPVTKSNEILMVVEPRAFTKDTVALGFPAGYIESNETPMEAAIRELREEAGYVSNNLIEIDSFYQDEGCSSAYNTSFIAFNSNKIVEPKLDKDEVVRTILLNYEELFELEKLGYICSSNAKLTLHKSKPFMKGR